MAAAKPQGGACATGLCAVRPCLPVTLALLPSTITRMNSAALAVRAVRVVGWWGTRVDAVARLLHTAAALKTRVCIAALPCRREAEAELQKQVAAHEEAQLMNEQQYATLDLEVKGKKKKLQKLARRLKVRLALVLMLCVELNTNVNAHDVEVDVFRVMCASQQSSHHDAHLHVMVVRCILLFQTSCQKAVWLCMNVVAGFGCLQMHAQCTSW